VYNHIEVEVNKDSV